ncbi:hypothetical protein [Lacrimispora brassicae]
MFIGGCFSGSNSSLVSSPVDDLDVKTLTVKNAVFDEIYASVSIIKISDFNGSFPSEWNFDTRLHALFQDNLYGGNVNFSESIVEFIRIKKKTKHDLKFKTIYEKPINRNEDFSILFMDYYEPFGEVEYAYVPVISGGEGDYIGNKVKSEFESYFLCDKDISYPMILDTSFTKKLNHNSNIIELQGRKKPVVIKNGIANYYSGDVSCTFIELKDQDWCTRDSWEYRNKIYEFLTDGHPKILKDILGNVYMISVTGEISEESDHDEHVTTKFSVVECGDVYDIGDMYDNGFIDTDLDR